MTPVPSQPVTVTTSSFLPLASVRKAPLDVTPAIPVTPQMAALPLSISKPILDPPIKPPDPKVGPAPSLSVSRYIFTNGLSPNTDWGFHLNSKFSQGQPIWDIASDPARDTPVGVSVGQIGTDHWLIWREKVSAQTFKQLHYWQGTASPGGTVIVQLWGTNRITTNERPSHGSWVPIGLFVLGSSQRGPQLCPQFTISDGRYVQLNNGQVTDPESTLEFGIWGITPVHIPAGARGHGPWFSRISVNTDATVGLMDNEQKHLTDAPLEYI